MNNVFRFILSLSIITIFASLTFAFAPADRVDLAQFACHPEALAGRTIEVDANIVAITADGRIFELFDSQSHTRIDVRLTQVRKADRMALLHSGVRRVSVSGRASVVAGRLTIDAENIKPAPAYEQQVQAGTDTGKTPPAAVVSLTIPNN
jgi:hypothetical protein